MAEFRMPSLGADMEAGKVVQWLVHPGDVVHRGAIVAVVDTDKADVEIEIFDDGVIDELLVPEGEKVPVGTVLATVRPLDGASEPAPPALMPPAPAASPPPAPTAPPSEAVAPAPATPATGGLVHSPVIRRLAHHLGVDISTVPGSGPGGLVTRADVEHAAQSGPPQPSPIPTEPPGVDRHLVMRRRIAALMARSKREIPHYYLGTHVDLRRTMAWLERTNLERPVAERLLPAALFLKAVALAVHDVPDLNGFWVDDHLEPSASVHLGVAVSLREGGLIAPAIHDADELSPSELMAALRDLVMRTRAGRLRASEMSDPTITVTSLGDQGVDTVYGVIYPPQVAIVGFGKVVERPWAVDGMVGAHPIVSATLAADHRASDGHRGARFLAAVDRILQEPEAL